MVATLTPAGHRCLARFGKGPHLCYTPSFMPGPCSLRPLRDMQCYAETRQITYAVATLHLLGIAASPGSARDQTSTTYRPSCLGLAASDHSGVCNTTLPPTSYTCMPSAAAFSDIATLGSGICEYVIQQQIPQTQGSAMVHAIIVVRVSSDIGDHSGWRCLVYTTW